MVRFCFVAVWLVCAAGPVFATSVVRFEFDSLCVRAQTIVHVRCVGSESVEDEASGRIATRTRFEVLSAVKGEPGAEIVVTLPGGKVGERRFLVPGMPQFAPGEETVLFLSGPDAFGSPWPVGLGQGSYDVVAADGEQQVRLQAGVTPLPPGPRFKPASSQPYQVPLSLFLQEVQRAISPVSADP